MKKLYSTSKFSVKKTMPIKNMVNRFLPTWSNSKGLVIISSPKKIKNEYKEVSKE